MKEPLVQELLKVGLGSCVPTTSPIIVVEVLKCQVQGSRACGLRLDVWRCFWFRVRQKRHLMVHIPKALNTRDRKSQTQDAKPRRHLVVHPTHKHRVLWPRCDSLKQHTEGTLGHVCDMRRKILEKLSEQECMSRTTPCNQSEDGKSGIQTWTYVGGSIGFNSWCP